MLFLVVGPPAGGKSTWVKNHAQPGDIVVDSDALANTLSPHGSSSHDHSPAVKAVTKEVRRAAIDAAVAMHDDIDTDVYVIHSMPSEQMLRKYHRLGARIVVVDPGPQVVGKRAEAERPPRMRNVVDKWYADITDYVHQFESYWIREEEGKVSECHS